MTGWRPTVLDQGKRKEPVESAYSGLGFEMSRAWNIIDTCLLEQDRMIVKEMEVPTMVGEGFVCLNKVSFDPFLLSFFSHIN